MDPGIYNFTIYQGTDDGLSFTVTENTVPVELSAFNARMQIRKTYDASSP